MTDKKNVLVTGAAGYWGARVATRLVAISDLHVIGIDSEKLADSNGGLDFIQADVRNPLLLELLNDERVDVICHLSFGERADGNDASSDLNVMGAMKLLAAAAESGVGKVIFRSSTAVYGARANNSAFLTEDTPLRGSRRYGSIRDLIEIEAFVNGFRGQSPETAITVLRFSNIVGLTADTPMTRFLRMQSPPVLLGFDPLMQLIHEDDVVEALVYSVLNDFSGIFNVGAEGPMPLSRILRLARRVPMRLFHPFAYKSFDLLSGTRFQPKQFVPIEWDYLRYPWVTDLTRMQTEMGYYPIYLPEEALREFAGQQLADAGDDQADLGLTDEQQLRDVLERRRRIRERQSAGAEEFQD